MARTSEPKTKKKRLPAAVPGTGGRFYRDAEGNNLITEAEHLSAKKAADNAKGDKG